VAALPDMALVLAVAVLVAAGVALPLASRGGRFRALPGWVAFWAFFAGLLVLLSKVPIVAGLVVLGAVMFGSMRDYFFLAPMRPRDRWAILVAYLTIPAVLVPVYTGSYGAFLAGVLLSLLLIQPAALSVGTPQPGLLDALGRVLLGLLVFVFCAGHLGWMAQWEGRRPDGLLELFGILVLGSELPQRIAGRLRPGEAVLRPLAGIVGGIVAAAGLALWLGADVEVRGTDAVVLGVLVACSVAAGRTVTEAVSQDLSMAPGSARVGRGALLDRAMPAVYAAPLFFHYVQHFV
jgi:predicted CDP-diglyceride synthetase/phosphatidate cytidylyltransferase